MTGRLPLATAAFDRAAHRRGDDAWLAEAWQRARVVAVSPKSRAPAARDDAGEPHLVYREPSTGPDAAARRFLGVVDDVAYFTVVAEPDDRDEWLTLRDIGPRADDLEAGLLTAAVALEQWHQRHTHCPLCGTPTVEANAGWTRTCPNDGSEHFPRTDPAVIMLVHDGGDRCLLGRQAVWPPGRFSILAGFIEPGESAEGAVAREIAEEVSLRVTDIRYVASQPWPFPQSLMLGFTARVDGDDTIKVDADEIEEARWFTRDELRSGNGPRALPPPVSIARNIIDRWIAGEV